MIFPLLHPPVVWPPPPEPPRIELVGVLRDSGDLKAAVPASEAIREVFRGPRPPIRFTTPHGVAVSSTDLVAVADVSGAAVHILDLATRTHLTISGFSDQRFAAPVGVAWAGTRLFVTDAQRHEVIELDAGGTYRRRFGGDLLTRPVGIAFVAALNRLCVVDGGAHRLTLFDLSGDLAGHLGGRGDQPGRFNFPTHVAAVGDRLIVSDSGNARVQILDLDGDVIRTIGRRGDGAGDLALPKGVAVDSDGHVYVVDARFENIQVFDASGRLLLAVGREGIDPGRFVLPAGLAIDRHDRIWVADAGNRRLQVLAYKKVSP